MSPSADLRRRTVKSLFWQLLGVGGQRVVQMVSLAALWRLIPDTDLGLFFVLLTGIGVIEALTMFVGEQTTISSQNIVDRRYLDTVLSTGNMSEPREAWRAYRDGTWPATPGR